jgi:hypothetical protein
MTRKTAFITICLLLISLSHVVAYPDNLLFTDYGQQSRYCDSLRGYVNDLDSAHAAALLDDLEHWADRKGDLQLKYCIRLVHFRNNLWHQKDTSAKLVSDCQAFGDELEKYNMPQLHADLLQTLGEYYWSREKYSLAFENFINAYNIYSKLPIDKFPGKPQALFGFASKYFYFRDFFTAKKYLLESVSAMRPGHMTSYTTTLNTLALSYRSLDMDDSAVYYFNKAYEYAMQQHDGIWPAILSGNLGYTYYLQRNYDKALPLLQKDADSCLKGERDIGNAANSLAVLSEIHLRKGETQKALDEALLAYRLLLTHNFVHVFKYKKNISLSLARVYAAMGNYSAAYNYLDSASMANDSLEKHANILVLSGIQHKMTADRDLQEAMKMQHQKKLAAWIRDAVIAGCIMMVIIAVLFINRLKLKNQQEKERMQNEQLLAKAELEDASRQLTDFTRLISDKNDLIETFAAELRRLKAQSGIDNAQEAELLAKLQQSTIFNDKQWQNFQALFNTANKEFIRRLHKKLPGLSPVETRFILLSKLRLSTPEMSGVLGISTEAVKQNVRRLGDKLGLPESEQALEDFVATI